MPPADAQFQALLRSRLNQEEIESLPRLTDELARTLIERIDRAPLFAHAYALLGNLTYGGYGPDDVLDFAHRNGLAGACIHLEISTTRRADVDEVVRIAGILGVRQIRVYSRFEGTLSQVMTLIEHDLHRLASLADEHDLHFSFEQHEELRSTEIAELLGRVSHPRLHAMFDFGNMINACERPMDALTALAPHILQAHLKGVHVLPEGDGYGHRGVLQGSPEDDLPGARMLFELLMLGEDEPQVIALALEQENLYYAPAFRHAGEGEDPFIPYRDLSTTGIPAGWTRDDLLAAEPGWADHQVAYVKDLLTSLRDIAVSQLDTTNSLAGAR